jgi:hypothetical protein
MIRHVADQRMPERGLWAEVSGGKLEMTMNEADDLEALRCGIDALRGSTRCARRTRSCWQRCAS